MKCDGRQCGGFTTLGVLLSLTVLSVAVSFCVKWYVSQNHQRSILRQKQRLVPCADAFSLFIKEQTNTQSCVGTWYAVRNVSDGVFNFVRKSPGMYDFRVEVEDAAWIMGKTTRFGITPQEVSDEHITEPARKKHEFLIVRFYAYEKTHILYTYFVPAMAKQFKAEELTLEPVERFMLTPKSDKSSKNEDK